MKKTLALSAALLVGFSAITSAATLTLSNVLDDPTPKEWGYASNNDIEVVGFNVEEGLDPEIADADFVLKTPVLTDEKNQEVQEYTIFLSPHPIKDLMEGENIYEYRDRGFFLPVYKIMDMGGLVELRIPVTEQEISKTDYYYGFVIPSDNNGDIGDRSQDFCFNFATEEYASGEECESLGVVALDYSEEEHGSAGADMGLADISHTVDYNRKVITLTWTSVAGSELVKIQFFDTKSKSFVDLATVSMLDERYEYFYDDTVNEYIFALIPEASPGKEKRYELNVRHETKEESKVTTVPEVGPAEDMLMIFGVAVLLYGGYVALRSKAKAEK